MPVGAGAAFGLINAIPGLVAGGLISAKAATALLARYGPEVGNRVISAVLPQVRKGVAEGIRGDVRQRVRDVLGKPAMVPSRLAMRRVGAPMGRVPYWPSYAGKSASRYGRRVSQRFRRGVGRSVFRRGRSSRMKRTWVSHYKGRLSKAARLRAYKAITKGRGLRRQ